MRVWICRRYLKVVADVLDNLGFVSDGFRYFKYRSLVVESTDEHAFSVTGVWLLTGNGIIQKGDWGSPSDSRTR